MILIVASINSCSHSSYSESDSWNHLFLVYILSIIRESRGSSIYLIPYTQSDFHSKCILAGAYQR